LKLLIDFGPLIGRKKSSAQIPRHYRPDTLVGRQVAAAITFRRDKSDLSCPRCWRSAFQTPTERRCWWRLRSRSLTGGDCSELQRRTMGVPVARRTIDQPTRVHSGSAHEHCGAVYEKRTVRPFSDAAAPDSYLKSAKSEGCLRGGKGRPQGRRGKSAPRAQS
jgi:hypothetical protein